MTNEDKQKIKKELAMKKEKIKQDAKKIEY